MLLTTDRCLRSVLRSKIVYSFSLLCSTLVFTVAICNRRTAPSSTTLTSACQGSRRRVARPTPLDAAHCAKAKGSLSLSGQRKRASVTVKRRRLIATRRQGTSLGAVVLCPCLRPALHTTPALLVSTRADGQSKAAALLLRHRRPHQSHRLHPDPIHTRASPVRSRVLGFPSAIAAKASPNGQMISLIG
jgi:hypothetical protein